MGTSISSREVHGSFPEGHARPSLCPIKIGFSDTPTFLDDLSKHPVWSGVEAKGFGSV